jgi:dTMP kinase
MREGLFITFEGPEGGGKTTQARRLIARLAEEGHEVLYTREPGGTPTGEMIRDILQHDKAGEPICPETELFLFEASRAQLVRNVILPALEKGTHVVCDRFADSTTAYQGYGRGFPVESLIAINELAIGKAVPDVTLLLDVTIDRGFERLASRQRELFQVSDRIEREEREFHERVRKGYLDLARRWPERYRILDAARNPDAVEQDVWKEVQKLLSAS